MKKLFSFVRPYLIPLGGIFLIIFLFSACKKTVDTVQQPAAGLMAFNLAPDKAAIGVALSGNNFTNTPLAYTNYTGGYRGVFVGNRSVESYDYSSGATLATTQQLFKDSAYYSLFVLGTEGHYTNLLVQDNLDSLSSANGEAYVRYVNAIPDSTKPLVTISSGGTNVINNNAAYATVSDFTAITPGDISITVNNESTFNVNRTISLESGKVYTILLTGIPAQTDTTKTVQIKFISNGIVTP
jgi:hypothetical protein